MSKIEDFKKSFEDSSSEDLLERRALGKELCDEAHKAIEIIFAERGENLPPIPSKTIFVSSSTNWPNSKFLGYAIFILVVVFGYFIEETFKAILRDFSTRYPIVFTAITLLIIAVAALALWRQRTEEKRSSPQQMEKLMESEGLTELMIASEKGDIARVQELLIYDPMTINKTSASGATALMFAARNDHESIVQHLLENGADAGRKTSGGSTALSIAQRYKFSRIIDLLKNKGLTKTNVR